VDAVIAKNANVNSVAAEAANFFEAGVISSFSCFEVPQKNPQRSIHAEFHDGALKRRAGSGNYGHPHRSYSQIRFQVWVFKLLCTVTKLCALKPLSGKTIR
jgi:hypothetical protein